MWIRVGFGVGDRSRRFLRWDVDRERPLSLDRSTERRFALSSLSLSALRLARSFERPRSFDSLRTSPFEIGLLLRVRVFDLRFVRLSPPLLDEVEELELDDDELDELEREPELRDDELLSDELPLLELDPLPRRFLSRSRPRVDFFSFSFSATGDAVRSRAIFVDNMKLSISQLLLFYVNFNVWDASRQK